MDARTIENLIREGLPNAEVRVENLRMDGENHYAAYITCSSFLDKTRVEQHRLVYAALKGAMDPEIHALTLKTCSRE